MEKILSKDDLNQRKLDLVGQILEKVDPNLQPLDFYNSNRATVTQKNNVEGSVATTSVETIKQVVLQAIRVGILPRWQFDRVVTSLLSGNYVNVDDLLLETLLYSLNDTSIKVVSSNFRAVNMEVWE